MNASWHNSSGTSNTQQNSGDVKRWKSMRIRMSERMRKMMSKKRMRWRKRKRKRRRKSMPGLNVDGVRCLQCGTYTVMNGESSARSVGHRLIPELSLQFPEKLCFLWPLESTHCEVLHELWIQNRRRKREAFQDIDDTLEGDVKRRRKRMHAHRQCLYAENVPARI